MTITKPAINAIYGNNCHYYGNHTNHINTLCWQKGVFP